MKDLPVADRPREKIAKKGVPVLSDGELIEVIIGRGTKGNDVRMIAREIASRLSESPDITAAELQAIRGVGPSKASQILACIELGRRTFLKNADARRIATAEDVVSLPQVQDIRGKRQEHFIAITLNGAGDVLNARTVTVGLLNHSLVHPREVFADAITDRAASLICVHNHPCGSLEPSSRDVEITAQLRDAGAVIGIQVIDHIIVTKSAHTSLHERGFI